MIKAIKKYLNRSEFIKNTLTLISGTTIAQLLPVLISPILSRLYKPDAFGVLATFTSLTVIFSMIASGRYELAIVLPKKDSYGINILFLSFFLSLIISGILLLVVFLFHDKIVYLLKLPKISGWLYLIPFVVLFLSGYNALTYFLTRMKKFKQISTNKVIRSITVAIVQLGLFFTKNGTFALVTGYSTGQLGGEIAMLRSAIKNKKLLKQVNFAKMKALAKRYKRFPQVQMPSTLLNRLSTDMPNLLLASLFDAATLGFYSMGFRVLAVPSTFIGMAVSQVFMQAANEEFIKTGKITKIFKSVLKKLLIIGIPTFLIIGLFSKFLFGFIFGSEWTESGLYAEILTPLFFVRFIAASLSTVLYIFEKHKIIFSLQTAMFLLSVGIFAAGFYFKLQIIPFLWLYSIILTIYYLVHFFMIWKVANNKL